MDKETFLSLYRLMLGVENIVSNTGLQLLDRYIEELGTDNHKLYKEAFITVVATLPPLYRYCINHVIDYYVNKFSVVKLIKHDPNWREEKIILVY